LDTNVSTRRDPHPADPLACIGDPADEAEPLVAGHQRVPRVERRVGGVEELDPRGRGHLDVGEDQANADVVAGVDVPGTKNETSVTLLLTAVNSRWALKATKSFGNPKTGASAGRR